MQEILPRIAEPGTISPPVLGELSRRLPSDIDVQNTFPVRNGLVGNSRMCLFPFAYIVLFGENLHISLNEYIKTRRFCLNVCD